jgi:putative tricarboxylic transport membrane protein
MAEASFRQAMLLSQGSLSIFWANPLVGTIMGLGLLMLFWQPVMALAGKRGYRTH